MRESGLVALHSSLGEPWLKWVVFFDRLRAASCAFGSCTVDWPPVRIMKLDSSLLRNYSVIIGVVYLASALCTSSIGTTRRCMNSHRNKVLMITWLAVLNLMCCMLCLLYRGRALVQVSTLDPINSFGFSTDCNLMVFYLASSLIVDNI